MDDSGSSGAPPATTPLPRRAARAPRPRRSSNWGRIDTVTAGPHGPVGTSAPPPTAVGPRATVDRRTGRVAQTCALCHTSSNPVVPGATSGRPDTAPERWPRSVVIVDPAAPGETITRYRPTGNLPASRRSWAAARSCRRSRFLTTAVPTFREMAKAMAGLAPPSCGTYTTLRGPLRARCVEALNARNAARPLIRSIDRSRTIRRTGAGGPCAGEP